ncbi:MAG: DMT family transporter [Rhizobiaceae bacterium]|jgi:drug/metabolite transporter (DMT)-like permease|nr:DMT family transporter [Rhizobiaceae bacterium]
MADIQNTELRSPALAYGLGLVGITIFGSTLPVTAVALSTFNPAFVTFGRASLAACAAGLVLVLLRRRLPRAHVPQLLAGGFFTVFGFPLLMAIALQTVPASHGGVVLGVLPLLTALFAALLAGERLPRLFWVCACLGAALVIVFSLRDSRSLTLSTGDLWLLAAAIAASLGYVIFGRLARHMPAWETISWAMVLVAPASFAITLWQAEPARWVEAGWTPWLALFWLGMFSQYVGFFAWNAGLAMGGIARIGQVQLLQAFVTIALSAWLLGEAVSLETLAFAVAVGFVVWLGSRARQRRAP